VLGANAGEVAPDLAPTHHAVAIFHPHQHRRPVVHDAEGGLHRHVHWRAKYQRFHFGQPQQRQAVRACWRVCLAIVRHRSFPFQ